MPTRHFNYTNRKKIHRSDVQIKVDRTENGFAISPWYRLAGYGLPDFAVTNHLAAVEIDALVAFLRSLDGEGYQDTAPKAFPQ